MTIVVVLFESSVGSSIRKGLLRLAGTLMGAAAGIAICERGCLLRRRGTTRACQICMPL